jgi:phosphatidylserine/phosphatidylglycerophosphate/cardiolipin synthase-like enzyme
MRVFDADAKRAVRAVIDENWDKLKAIPGFVSAEPGFPIIDGTVHKEPAIIVFVAQKRPPTELLPEDRAPRQLGPYRVSVMQADPLKQVMNLMAGSEIADSVEESDANLTYEPIEGNPIETQSFKVKKPILCHSGPDAGWPVLKKFIEDTRKTISLAMYDFNAEYIAKTFIETVRDKDLKAVVTWDDGMTAPETKIRKNLRSKLKDQLDGWIVRCGSSRRFASAYHEKVMVRDSKDFWLSSGNWSLRSQPDIDPVGEPSDAKGMYSKGNREWHVIVDDEPLAKLFEQYIKHDRDGSEAESEGGDMELDAESIPRLPDLFVPVDALYDADDVADAPSPVAPAVLPTTPRDIVVVPVLTPDNYLGRINALIASAKRSIYLQYAYITYSDKPADQGFTEMLAALAELSNRSGLDVRIIVGSTGAADKIRLLVEAGFNETVFRSQSSVHNKGIVVDGERVLVSSANWSGDGVLRNRDAGLIIHDKEIAGYYQDIFLYDWENRASSYIEDDPPVTIATEGEETPPGMVRMPWRDYFS